MFCLPPRADSNNAVNRINVRLRLAALLIWASALAFFSLAPDIRAPSGLLGWDKFNHFAAYVILTFLLIRALTTWYAVSPRLLTVAWMVCASYGLLLEGLQWAMEAGRQWEVADLLANGFGALVACVLFRHINRRF
ncbi:MAG: VanZ family protein [Desulfuromonadales bacterium]|nr:VanZ family protein [Desulfuromonadales bacterium]